ncbi:hypothetical protein [Homoserinibacter sp. GY 40078]|uniref:hypothetical protein n=1 Tax=Homoserinibacter sp. GY 40078 TaxID=2603275 RepID=UPI0011CB6156|nr:hypothetical protein [Homoserinibacter sp. GY 40078]TXK18471.1 hypothetical protein FVQ89_00445 [Homoserinibacter sp. GY 40078]
MTIQPWTAVLLGALLLSLITVESGGWFLTRVVRGSVPANALQTSFFRAGHAHAAVLLLLSLAVIPLLDTAELPLAIDLIARFGIPTAALLMPAGFFLSVLGRDPQRPGRAIAVLWIGAASLTLGLAAAGVGLIGAGVSQFG